MLEEHGSYGKTSWSISEINAIKGLLQMPYSTFKVLVTDKRVRTLFLYYICKLRPKRLCKPEPIKSLIGKTIVDSTYHNICYPFACNLIIWYRSSEWLTIKKSKITVRRLR